MRLTVALLGWELDLTLGPETTEQPEDDKARDLSGGALGSLVIEPGPADTTLGFTLGLEADDDRHRR